MTTIEFTFIPDRDADYQLQLEFLEKFKQQTGIQVKLTQMRWDNAWEQLIDMATHGQGADISHVGSTWVSSLMGMNALRPIPPNLLAKIGGEGVFVHSAWESTVLEDKQSWAIPFSAYTYAIAYRRDLLEKVGLDGAKAFGTPSALEETISRLEKLKDVERAWLMPYMPFPFNELVHTVATWVWSSGGHLIDNRGQQVLFDSPAVLAGLKAYFQLLRRQPEEIGLTTNSCMQRIVEGRAAAVLTDVRSIMAFLQQDAPETRHIETASVMGIPWTGGNNLVIWRHTYGYPDRLEAAFKLVEFLTQKSNMLEMGQRVYTLPARADALEEMFPVEHRLRPVITQLISSGRPYRTIRLWRRIEKQFGEGLDTIARAVLKDKETDLDAIVTETMRMLTKRLNLTLG